MRTRVLALVFYIPLLLACEVLPPVSGPTAVQSEEAASHWREDLQHLTQQMLEIHPNLFSRVSRDAWEQAVQALDETIPHLTDAQIIAGFARILAMVEDGHTFLTPLQEDTGFQIFPLRLYLFDDGLYVIDALPPYEQSIGARVVRVGQMEVEAAYEQLAPIISRQPEHDPARGADLFSHS